MADPKIGDLRWQVTLARRGHVVDAYDLTKSQPNTVFSDQRKVSANIVPVGTAAYLAGQQLEIGAVTHRITIRWQPQMVTADVVLRDTLQPDGTTRQDVYRVHRQESWQGRQRFLILDVELETTP